MHPGFELRSFVLFVLLVTLGFSACRGLRSTSSSAPETVPASTPKHHSKPVEKSAVAPKPVDVQAQQRYYDMGLKYYSEEKYEEAKQAWKQVLQLGANTPLSAKAREYLKKTDQVLKTLQEMEKR